MADITLKFSEDELVAIECALKYLLGAGLIPENSHTEEVVDSINSSLSKIQTAKKLSEIFGDADFIGFNS